MPEQLRKSDREQPDETPTAKKHITENYTEEDKAGLLGSNVSSPLSGGGQTSMSDIQTKERPTRLKSGCNDSRTLIYVSTLSTKDSDCVYLII